MNRNCITVRELIKILNKVNPNLEVVIERHNPDYGGGYGDYPTVYTIVEQGRISIKDGCLVLDIG